MPYSQIVLSVIIPIVVALGGTVIGALFNRRLTKADAGDKVSSSYSKLVDDLQEEIEKLKIVVEKEDQNYIALKTRQDNCESIYNKQLEELGDKYSKLISENIELKSQHAELRREYAEHRERSRERLESLKRVTEMNTEILESKINEYKQTIGLQEQRIQVLEKSANGGSKI